MSGLIDVGHREQHEEMLFVFKQAAIAHLAIAELAFQNAERMLDRRADPASRRLTRFSS